MIYIKRDSEVYGPYSETEAYEHFKAGQFLQSDLASADGQGNWKPLLDVLLSAGKATASNANEGSAKSKPLPQGNRTKWIVAGVVSLVVVAIGIFFYPAVQQKRELAQHKREEEAQSVLFAQNKAVANEALAEFQRIESSLQAGIDLREYSQLVLDAKINIDRILPRILDEEWRESLNDAMTTYIVARDFWMRSNELRRYGVPYIEMTEEDRNLFSQYGMTCNERGQVYQKDGLRQIWEHAKHCSGDVEYSFALEEAREIKSRHQK